MAEDACAWTELVVRFPLGTYHAQSVGSFGDPEWPPHPVRLIAALVAAAASLPETASGPARAAIATLSACPDPPAILAPRVADALQADGRKIVSAFRGAAQWAPRNHELPELRPRGVYPRVLDRVAAKRGLAEVHKGGVAVGEQPLVFSWPVQLDDDEQTSLARAADEITVLGTSHSPVVVAVRQASDAPVLSETWMPVAAGRARSVDVRVPTAGLPAALDAWHARRAAPPKRDGRPQRAGFVAPASLGRLQPYMHGSDLAPAPPFDPEWWGDMLVVAIDREAQIRPKAVASYSIARAVRAALLAQYDPAATTGEAPPVLRGRGEDPHAAVVALPFVGHERADGRLLGLAILLPHRRRLADVLLQRRRVEHGLKALLIGDDRPTIGVPGIGDVRLGPVQPGAARSATLRTSRWRQTAARWSTVTPVVHSRYRRNDRPASLLEQVAADCRDVGLPEPRAVELRRRSRFAGAPAGIARRHLPDGWLPALRGPLDHLDLEFDQPVVGPILLGRARHFGVGLCLPTPTGTRS